MDAINSTSSTQPLQLTIRPEGSFWSEEAPTFSDFLDIINPLQHIPIISNIYQALTGDTASTGSKIAGGALFGGPIGFIASIVDSIVQQESGKDMGGNMLAMFDSDTAEQMQTASNDTAQYAYSSKAYLKTAALF